MPVQGASDDSSAVYRAGVKVAPGLFAWGGIRPRDTKELQVKTLLTPQAHKPHQLHLVLARRLTGMA